MPPHADTRPVVYFAIIYAAAIDAAMSPLMSRRC